MRKNVIYMIVGGLVVSLFGLAGCSGGNSNFSQVAATCTALNGTKINDVTITSTKWFEASSINPSFCQPA